MNMTLMIAELRRDEGVRYSPYRDNSPAKNWTVGVGHNLSASPIPPEWSYPLTDEQVNALLTSDLGVTFGLLDHDLPWWRGLDEVRQRVVANMAFNMGVTDLLDFHNALGAMQRGAYAIAAAAMLNSDWYGEVGDRAVRLCSAMETDVMPDEPVVA